MIGLFEKSNYGRIIWKMVKVQTNFTRNANESIDRRQMRIEKKIQLINLLRFEHFKLYIYQNSVEMDASDKRHFFS